MEPAEPRPSPPTLDDPLRRARYIALERLFEHRIVFLRGPLEDDPANEVVAQLLALDGDSADDVQLYIDTPGGSSSAMFAIHDVVQSMRAPVHTRCVGMAASAGAVLLAAGTGTRSATRNARILLHQPLGDAEGTAADIMIQAEEIARLRQRLVEILAERTGQPIDRIRADIDRDFWLSADEARAYGLIDEVVAAAAR